MSGRSRERCALLVIGGVQLCFTRARLLDIGADEVMVFGPAQPPHPDHADNWCNGKHREVLELVLFDFRHLAPRRADCRILGPQLSPMLYTRISCNSPAGKVSSSKTACWIHEAMRMDSSDGDRVRPKAAPGSNLSIAGPGCLDHGQRGVLLSRTAPIGSLEPSGPPSIKAITGASGSSVQCIQLDNFAAEHVP
jgi:hypothetical protein